MWNQSAGLALLEFRARVDYDPYGAFSNWNPNDDDPCMLFGGCQWTFLCRGTCPRPWEAFSPKIFDYSCFLLHL
ncbi:hypothetical protein CsSME_00036169 [Camellia sinensis var. sinensis]